MSARRSRTSRSASVPPNAASRRRAARSGRPRSTTTRHVPTRTARGRCAWRSGWAGSSATRRVSTMGSYPGLHRGSHRGTPLARSLRRAEEAAMTTLLITLALLLGYLLFVAVKPDRTCRKCGGNALLARRRIRRRTSACARCRGTGTTFRPGARLVHRGIALGIRSVRQRREQRREMRLCLVRESTAPAVLAAPPYPSSPSPSSAASPGSLSTWLR